MYPNACLSQWKRFFLCMCSVYDVHVSALVRPATYAWQAEFNLRCVWPRTTAQPSGCIQNRWVYCWNVREIMHELKLYDHMQRIHKHDTMLAYPPNLSILISGGKYTKLNAFSHCEWTRIKSQLETMILTLNCCICMYCHSGYGCKLFATSSNLGWQPRMLPAHNTYGVHCSSSVPLEWNANGC